MKKEIFTILAAFALPVGTLTIATNESSASTPPPGARVVKAVEDVFGQGLDGSVVAREGATLWRTPNGISIQLKMPAPEPGEYIYPSGGEAFSSDDDHPEVFTLWAFVFNNPPADDWDGAFALSGEAVAGAEVSLSGYVTRDTEPFTGEKLANPRSARVHVMVAPHGTLDPELIPDALEALPGQDISWIALFR